ncbi:single-stranded DNA-binding protein [Clostridium cellulovorans]|jgi:single-strand DNA-binding protein|uniref:Single-stranded DNA-binding protein n=1 Tax=Clostridium cellulovorans (strain ATCC 35296 / DSM 3052 / OCM 3 / 743B) TaxID=573061 RepID=D9SWF8_CLOC7|nr:single-stranded DNA-binding protein [Clostridium cellulovorans]ADL53240.1 single-strand binding protein [Clostridium cellulovorans 743B]
MNKAVLIGRLVRDPELKFAQGTGTAVANFTIAVDRRFSSKDGQKETDFIPIVVFGKIAETVANYTTKGKLIGVSGRIQTRTYDAQDGGKRYVTEVVSDEVQFLEWGNGNQQSNNQSQSSNQGFGGGFDDNFTSPCDDSDDSIPF